MAALPGTTVDDSWLLSAAAALAEHPPNIHNMIKNKDTSNEGIYEFTFFMNAFPLSVIIDNRLPLTAQELPINAQLTSDDAQWMVLLEKAFAKISVNYANLNRGHVQEALRMLTGRPVITYQLKELNSTQVFAMVAERSRRNETVVAECGPAKYGLVRGQTYTVIAAISIEGDGRAPRNMIKLRNPLFKGTYTGPWHEDDGRWTNAYKVAAGYTQAEDNFFFMPLDAFTETFRELTVVESENLAIAQSKTKSTGQKFSYSFQNPANQSEAIITLDYLTPRMYPAGCERPDVQYSISLKDADGDVVEKGSVSLQYSYGYVKVQDLPKGVYELEILNLADP
jgi:hypothetical protein